MLLQVHGKSALFISAILTHLINVFLLIRDKTQLMASIKIDIRSVESQENKTKQNKHHAHLRIAFSHFICDNSLGCRLNCQTFDGNQRDSERTNNVLIVDLCIKIYVVH